MQIFFYFFFFFVTISSLFANPSGPEVIAGQVDILSSQAHLLEVQASDKSIINWKDFSIDKGEITRFIQQNSTSCVLNRVTGLSPSLIQGVLEANGKVLLINPNGILVSKEGVVQTSGFIASTLDLLDQDFLQGSGVLFQDTGQSKEIVNLGTIRAIEGDVTLFATRIRNEGLLEAKNGSVQTSAGYEILLQPDKDEGFFIRPLLDKPLLDTGIENLGTIEAKNVFLGAQGSAYSLAMNQSGLIESVNVENSNGKIFLLAKEGSVQNSGSLLAPGGTITLASDEVSLKNGSLIDVSSSENGGSVLIGASPHDQTATTSSNPKLIEMEKSARILASSIENGSGGKVVLFADQSMNFQGNIEAKGGSVSGNGGFVEVSSKGAFVFQGKVDTTARMGTTGTLLLDPCDITITTTSPTNPGPFTPNYTPTSNTANVFNADVNSALITNNVVIDATSPIGGGTGAISVNAPISWGSAYSLTLTGVNIGIGSTITGTGGGDLNLNTTAGGLNVTNVVNVTGNITINIADPNPSHIVDILGLGSLRSGNILTFTSNQDIYLRSSVPGQITPSIFGTNGVNITANNGSSLLFQNVTSSSTSMSISSNGYVNITADDTISLTANNVNCFIGNTIPHPNVTLNCDTLSLNATTNTNTASIQSSNLIINSNTININTVGGSTGTGSIQATNQMTINPLNPLILGGITLNAASGATSIIAINNSSTILANTLNTSGALSLYTDSTTGSQAYIDTYNASLTITAESLSMTNNSPNKNMYIQSNYSGDAALDISISGNISLTANASQCYIGNTTVTPPNVQIDCSNLTLNATAASASAFIQSNNLTITSTLLQSMQLTAIGGSSYIQTNTIIAEAISLHSVPIGIGLMAMNGGTASIRISSATSEQNILETSNPFLMQTDGSIGSNAFITSNGPLSLQAYSLNMQNNTPGSSQMFIRSNYLGGPGDPLSLNFTIFHDATLSYNVSGAPGSVYLSARGNILIYPDDNLQLTSQGTGSVYISSDQGNLSLYNQFANTALTSLGIGSVHLSAPAGTIYLPTIGLSLLAESGTVSISSPSSISINASGDVSLTTITGECFIGNSIAPHPNVQIRCNNLILGAEGASATTTILANQLNISSASFNLASSPGQSSLQIDSQLSVWANNDINFSAFGGGSSSITVSLASSLLSTMTTNGAFLMQTDSSPTSSVFVEMNNAPLTVSADGLSMSNNAANNMYFHSNSTTTPALSFDISGDAALTAAAGSTYLSTTSANLLFNAGGDVTLSSLGSANAYMTSSANLTLDVDNLSLLQNSLLRANGSSGNILVLAGQNINLQNNGAITNASLSPGSVTLVVDNNFPTRPGIGPGSFLMGANATINASGLLKIYTARPDQNNASGTLQGYPYSARTDVYNVYYPNLDPGPVFTVFYKQPFSTPIIPTTPEDYLEIQQTMGNESSTISILEEFFFPWESQFCITYKKQQEPLSQMKDHIIPLPKMGEPTISLSNSNTPELIPVEISSPFEKERRKCYRVKEKTYQKNREIEG